VISIEAVKEAFPEFSDLNLIASSGQKHVFKATSGSTNVVLKIIKKSSDGDSRAEREAEAVSRLKSSFVPTLFAVGERHVAGLSTIYFVEQFIDGETYRSVLQKGRRSIKDILALGHLLLSACCEFEGVTLVHRDIKPENIIIGTDDKVWLLDFGIVRLLDLDSLTKTAAKFGPFTPGYGAPEQIRNQKDQIDIRADLFSVGVVMYESLAGVNPYLEGKRDAFAIVNHMLEKDLPRLELNFDGGENLSNFIAALISRYPSRRPDCATDALNWFLEAKAAVEKAN
jgi:eukaryotic-like serine/threonine-protein kinase